MNLYPLVLSAILLSACGSQDKPLTGEARSDEAAIAEVEAAQTPPPDVVAPERITEAERVRYKLAEGGCAFAVNNPELGAQAIMQMNVGYLKFGSEMERFAPDAGSAEGPAGTSSKYDGGRHALLVAYDSAASQLVDGGRLSVPTKITIQDGRGRTVYVGEGTSLCG